MADRICVVCARELPAESRADRKYCSVRCTKLGQAPCVEPGCGKPRTARRLCKLHYRRIHGRHTRTCVVCGEQWQTENRNGKYCTDWCKGYAYAGQLSCPVPDAHPSRSCAVPGDHPSRRTARTPSLRPKFYAGLCAECGKGYVIASAFVSSSSYCSTTCSRRVGKRARRAREAGASGTFTWDAFARLVITLGNVCAYCDGDNGGQPFEPDHVVPISRGGHNGLGNILPACHRCNGQKRDLLVHEWQADRASRGLPPKRYDVHRFMHLTAHDHSLVAA